MNESDIILKIIDDVLNTNLNIYANLEYEM